MPYCSDHWQEFDTYAVSLRGTSGTEIFDEKLKRGSFSDSAVRDSEQLLTAGPTRSHSFKLRRH